MNKKFKELADEARFKKLGDSWCYTLGDEFEQKFGELIVKECSRLIFTRDPRFEPAPHIYLLKAFGVNDE